MTLDDAHHMLFRTSVRTLLVMGKFTGVHGAVLGADRVCVGIKDDGALGGASWFLYLLQRTTTPSNNVASF